MMGDNLLPSERPTSNNNNNNNSYPRTSMVESRTNNPRMPADGGVQPCHPRTPLESHHPHTPVDGQLAHPRTPIDGQLCHSRGASSLDGGGLSDLSSDGSKSGHPLRHTAPGTPGNPPTPASSSCGSGRTCWNNGVGGELGPGNGSGSHSGGDNSSASRTSSVGNASRCSSSNGLYSSALANKSFANSGVQQQQQQQEQMQLQQQPPLSASSSSAIDNVFSTELGFHTSTLIDGDSMQEQESLDVSR